MPFLASGVEAIFAMRLYCTVHETFSQFFSLGSHTKENPKFRKIFVFVPSREFRGFLFCAGFFDVFLGSVLFLVKKLVLLTDGFFTSTKVKNSVFIAKKTEFLETNSQSSLV